MPSCSSTCLSDGGNDGLSPFEDSALTSTLCLMEEQMQDRFELRSSKCFDLLILLYPSCSCFSGYRIQWVR